MSQSSTRFDHAAIPLTNAPRRGGMDRRVSARTIVWRVVGALVIAAAFYLLVMVARHGQALDTIMSWITFGQRGR